MGQYIRYSVTTIDEVVEKIKFFLGTRRARAMLDCGYEVGVTSLRLKTFARAAEGRNGICCKGCGIRASHFAVEGFTGSLLPSVHANLYGFDGTTEVLFTHDHIIPVSRKGPNTLNNSQVMCQPCNSRKSARSDRKFKAEMRAQKC